MPGEEMYLQAFEEKKKFAGQLETVTDSFLVLAREQEIPDPADPRVIIILDTIPISKIFSIYANKRGSMGRFMQMYGSNAIAGGLLLMGGGGIMAAIENQRPDKTGFMIAGGIMVSGIIVKIFTRNKYRMGKKWQVKAMDPIIDGDFFREGE